MVAPRESPNLTTHGPAVDTIEHEALTSDLTLAKSGRPLDQKNLQSIGVLFKFAVALERWMVRCHGQTATPGISQGRTRRAIRSSMSFV